METGTIKLGKQTVGHQARLTALAAKREDGAYGAKVEGDKLVVNHNGFFKEAIEVASLADLREVILAAVAEGLVFSYSPPIILAGEMAAKYKTTMLNGLPTCWAFDAAGKGLSCLVLREQGKAKGKTSRTIDPIFG